MDDVRVYINTLFVIVRNRQKTLFMGEAQSVTCKNSKGPFDILPQHANFISMITDKFTIRPLTGESKEIKVDGPTVLKVRQNRVEVFLGI